MNVGFEYCLALKTNFSFLVSYVSPFPWSSIVIAPNNLPGIWEREYMIESSPLICERNSVDVGVGPADGYNLNCWQI